MKPEQEPKEKFNIEASVEDGAEIVDRLVAKLGGNYFLQGDLLNEVLADPDKLQKAKDLGLLPPDEISKT